MTREITGTTDASDLNETAPERSEAIAPWEAPPAPRPVAWDPLGHGDEMSQEGPGYAYSAPEGTFQGYEVPQSLVARGSRTEIVGGAGTAATGTIFDDIGDAVSDVGDWMSHAVTNAVDAIRTIPGIGFIVDQVDDFGKSTLGRAFFAVLGPGIMTEFFTTLPAVGMQASTALASLGPVATQMLPGLARGEPVDKVFVQSVKDVISRASSAGGGAVASQYLKDGVSAVSAKMAELGISPTSLHAAPLGVEIIPQQVRDAAANRLQAELATLSKKLQIPEDVLQAAVDGVTRTSRYNPNDFDAKTGVRLTDAMRAGNQVDAWLLERVGPGVVTKVIPGMPLLVSHGHTPDTIVVTGGRFRTSAEALALATQHAADFRGAMGQAAHQGLPYFFDRLNSLAKQGKRPAELVTHAADTRSVDQKFYDAQAAVAAAQASRNPTMIAQAAATLAQAQIAFTKEKAADAAQTAQRQTLSTEPRTIAEYTQRGNMLMAMATGQAPAIAAASRAQAAGYFAKAAAMQRQGGGAQGGEFGGASSAGPSNLPHSLPAWIAFYAAA